MVIDGTPIATRPETEDDVMTALLDPTRSFPSAPRTTAFPAAQRSAPEAMRTAAMAPVSTPETVLDDLPTIPRPSRRRAVLLAAAVALAGIATVVGVSAHAPLAPLPPAPGPGVASPSTCVGGSCEGLDPTSLGCQQDARTVLGRVVTAERRGLEVPVGIVELRSSAACHAVWARYTVDPTAPVGAVAIESRDGRTERTTVDAVAGHRHLGYGTTPMLAGSADVRAIVSPASGGELPSSATAWTGAR